MDDSPDAADQRQLQLKRAGSLGIFLQGIILTPMVFLWIQQQQQRRGGITEGRARQQVRRLAKIYRVSGFTNAFRRPSNLNRLGLSAEFCKASTGRPAKQYSSQVVSSSPHRAKRFQILRDESDKSWKLVSNKLRRLFAPLARARDT